MSSTFAIVSGTLNSKSLYQLSGILCRDVTHRRAISRQGTFPLLPVLPVLAMVIWFMLILSRCNHCLRGPQNQLLLASAAVLVSEERGGNVSKIHFGFKPGYGSNCKPYWLWRIAAKYTILCAGYGNPRVFRKIESFAVHATRHRQTARCFSYMITLYSFRF